MNSNFLQIGPITIKWYAIIILSGIIIGSLLAIKEAKKYHISVEFMLDLIIGTVISAIIGARLYYVIFNFDYYSIYPSEIFKIWHGGLAIHGGLILGLLWIILYTKKNKINPLKLTDIIVVSLILGQAIGRWGNFINGEAHGPITTLKTLQDLHIPNFIIEGMKLGANYYHPTFLYESLWCLLGFIILIFIRKSKKLKLGQLTGCYLIWYGIGRFFIEGLRTDSLLIGSLKVAQIVSVIMIIGGIILIIINIKNVKYREEKNEK